MENKPTRQEAIINPRDYFIKSPKEAKKLDTRTKVSFVEMFVCNMRWANYN